VAVKIVDTRGKHHVKEDVKKEVGLFSSPWKCLFLIVRGYVDCLLSAVECQFLYSVRSSVEFRSRWPPLGCLKLPLRFYQCQFGSSQVKSRHFITRRIFLLVFNGVMFCHSVTDSPEFAFSGLSWFLLCKPQTPFFLVTLYYKYFKQLGLGLDLHVVVFVASWHASNPG
jgi:hypothetical protein